MPVIDLGSVVGPAGATGATGATGPQGIQGNPGPNQVTANTSTTLNGILKGNGNNVTTATVDSSPNSSHSSNLISSAAVADALAKEIISVDCGTVSSLPYTKSDDGILASHVVLKAEVGTPAALGDDWTVSTSNGSLTISGTISRSTTLKLYLGKVV